MKKHFIRLFNYNQFANRQINNLLLTRQADKPVKLMAHLLGAEQIWLMRCKGIGTAGLSSWPDTEADNLPVIIDSNYQDWISFLNNIPEDELDRTVQYQNSTGAGFDTIMSDVIAHVLNHGTHTRAQIGQLLKLNDDDKLPVTDYSYYLRQSGR